MFEATRLHTQRHGEHTESSVPCTEKPKREYNTQQIRAFIIAKILKCTDCAPWHQWQLPRNFATAGVVLHDGFKYAKRCAAYVSIADLRTGFGGISGNIPPDNRVGNIL